MPKFKVTPAEERAGFVRVTYDTLWMAERATVEEAKWAIAEALLSIPLMEDDPPPTEAAIAEKLAELQAIADEEDFDDDVAWLDDTIATTPDQTIKRLAKLNKKIVKQLQKQQR
jgi:hypothetical protein